MRSIIALTLLFSLASSNALAANPDSAKKLTDAERERVKRQVEDLQNSKLKAAEAANKATREAALRKSQEVNHGLKKQKDQVDHDVEGLSWVYGRNAARLAGEAKKHELEVEAQAKKDKIAKEAEEKAARDSAAAKKKVDSIHQTVEGLKSQVSSDGKFGLQPKGSNLHVRNYGK